MRFGWLRLGMAFVALTAVGGLAAAGCGSDEGGSDLKAPDQPTGGFGVGGAPAAILGDDEICQCMLGVGVGYETNDQEGTPSFECASCWRERFEDECKVAHQSCLDDLECDGYFDCLTMYEYAPDSLQKCGIVPFDKNSSTELVRTVMRCACSACASKCEYPTPSCTVEINDPTNCQCIIDSVQSPTCQSCATAQQGDGCSEEYAACQALPSCASTLDPCLTSCTSGSGLDPSDCIQLCLGTEGSDARILAEAYFECLCTSPLTCYDECSGDAAGCGENTGGGGTGGGGMGGGGTGGGGTGGGGMGGGGMGGGN